MGMELDLRKQLVLEAIVNEYVRTAEPVGSERLAESTTFSAKSATIRNEMAVLSSLGYLLQPHTSAGRIPSDKGYRFYVDRLMQPVPAPRPPRARFDTELDEVLRQTCRILAGLTRCAAVAAPPLRDSVTVQQVHATPVTMTRVLVVVIFSSGDVQHRIADVGQSIPASKLTRMERIINEQLSGLTLPQARTAKAVLPEDLAGVATPAARMLDAIAQMVARDEDDTAVVEGTTQVLRQPEFQHEERRERLLSALEDRRALLESLRAMDEGVDVVIGSENPLPGLQELSFVSTRYYVGMSMSGVIGVFGPTRMAYSHTVPAVRSMARVLSDILTRMSVE